MYHKKYYRNCLGFFKNWDLRFTVHFSILEKTHINTDEYKYWCKKFSNSDVNCYTEEKILRNISCLGNRRLLNSYWRYLDLQVQYLSNVLCSTDSKLNSTSLTSDLPFNTHTYKHKYTKGKYTDIFVLLFLCFLIVAQPPLFILPGDKPKILLKSSHPSVNVHLHQDTFALPSQ